MYGVKEEIKSPTTYLFDGSIGYGGYGGYEGHSGYFVYGGSKGYRKMGVKEKVKTPIACVFKSLDR